MARTTDPRGSNTATLAGSEDVRRVVGMLLVRDPRRRAWLKDVCEDPWVRGGVGEEHEDGKDGQREGRGVPPVVVVQAEIE